MSCAVSCVVPGMMITPEGAIKWEIYYAFFTFSPDDFIASLGLLNTSTIQSRNEKEVKQVPYTWTWIEMYRSEVQNSFCFYEILCSRCNASRKYNFEAVNTSSFNLSLLKLNQVDLTQQNWFNTINTSHRKWKKNEGNSISHKRLPLSALWLSNVHGIKSNKKRNC